MNTVLSKKLVKEKIDRIKNGYSAYTETDAVTSMLRKEIQAQNLHVFEDVTDVGCWFIPEKSIH